MKNILYIVNSKKDINFKYSFEIINYLKDKNSNIFVEDSNLSEKMNLTMINQDLLPSIDLTIILGGDGTILTYLRGYGKYEIPILGINLGRVGALDVCELDNYQYYYEKYLNNEYLIEKYFTLEGKLEFEDGMMESFIVYNDVILHRGLTMKMLPINVGINGSDYDLIYADGVVVSTPSGSSAYNHSAGGPLLSPNSNSYVVTPICSQTKGFSSLVIAKSDVLHLSIDNTFDGLALSVDGCERHLINKNVEITIKESSQYFNLIQFTKDRSLYKAVYKVIDSINKIKGEN